MNTSQNLPELHRIFQQITEGISEYSLILLDEQGTILTWNKGVEKIKAYKAEEIIGQHISIFYLPEDRQIKLPEILLQEAREKGTAFFVGKRIRKNGTIFWGHIEITAIKDADNKIIGFTKLMSEFSSSYELDNFWFDTDGILHTKVGRQPNTPDKLAKFKSIIKTTMGNQRICCIADLRHCDLTEVGNSFIQSGIEDVYKAIAFVSDEKIDMDTAPVIGETASRLPTKVFKNRDSAKLWIKQFLSA